MSIGNISSSSSSSSSSIDPILARATQSSGSTGSISGLSGETISISKPGQLLGELKSLAESDPDKFKAVAAEIAKQLKAAASSQTGPAADHLNKLADRFGAAAQSGNVADLTPNAGQAHGQRHGHGGHHGHGGQAMANGGGGAEGSVAQTVEDIISTALGSSA